MDKEGQVWQGLVEHIVTDKRIGIAVHIYIIPAGTLLSVIRKSSAMPTARR